MRQEYCEFPNNISCVVTNRPAGVTGSSLTSRKAAWRGDATREAEPSMGT